MQIDAAIAYFSMEIFIDPQMPTYCGGLGVLAGDTIRAAADLSLPMAAVTLAHRLGYFTQKLDAQGRQHEEPARWALDEFTTELAPRVRVRLEGRDVAIRAWHRDVVGVTGSRVPVLLLDTDLPDNHLDDRRITDSLYGGDLRLRLRQEVVLGVGGVRMLRALGLRASACFHMNEGHSSLLTAELLRERVRASDRSGVDDADIAAVRARCAFTTHTPIAAGHDRFPVDLAREILGPQDDLRRTGLFVQDGTLDTTFAAMNLSRYTNAVAIRHGETTRRMFPGRAIDSITNGVHGCTWTTPAFQNLYDRHIPRWRADNSELRHALSISLTELWSAHELSKRELIDAYAVRGMPGLDPQALTIGCARRATGYKRLDLILSDPARLQRLSEEFGSIQILFAGKAHPRDNHGKEIIERLVEASREHRGSLRVAFAEDYDVDLCRKLVGGCDLWLNTPIRPLEASGTSGMKAAFNAVPSLSILDGWWIEGCIPGVTGWPIGHAHDSAPGEDSSPEDARALYDQLEHVILPMFVRERESFVRIMRHAVAINASHFNTHRMVRDYVLKAYAPALGG